MNLIFKDELKMEERKPIVKKLCGIVASVAFLTVISKANVLSSPVENDLSEGGSFDIQNESKFDQKPASCPNADASSTDRSIFLASLVLLLLVQTFYERKIRLFIVCEPVLALSLLLACLVHNMTTMYHSL